MNALERFFLAVATHSFPVALISTGNAFVEKLIKLRQDIQKENTLKELVRGAGEAKGLCIGSTVNEPGKHKCILCFGAARLLLTI